jgi:lactose/L-arabinose transport system substrate-binding protein
MLPEIYRTPESPSITLLYGGVVVSCPILIINLQSPPCRDATAYNHKIVPDASKILSHDYSEKHYRGADKPRVLLSFCASHNGAAKTKEETMKRVVTVSLFILLTAAVVFGGGQGSTGKMAGKTVTVWCWDPNFNGFSMQQAADVYKKIRPNVTVEIVDIPENIEGKIEAGLQAGGAGLPDIALFQDFVIEKFIQNYPGIFVDLKAEGVDYSKFAQYKVGPMTDGSKIYGIPFDTGSTGLFLRVDFMRDAGLNPDQYKRNMTWDEVIDLGTKIKQSGGKPLLAYDSTSYDFLRILVQSTGTQFFKPDGSLNFKTPALRKSLEYMKKMNDGGLFYTAEGWNNWVSAFNNGQSVGLLNALWIIGTLKSKSENAGKWMVAPTPLVAGVPGARNASNNGGSSWYVFASSKEKAEAVDFLKSTWASEDPAALEFYNIILKQAGAMGTFLPSRSGSNYTANDDFFYKSQPVFKDFAAWMENVPTLNYTANYLAMRDSLRNAMNLLFGGEITTIDETLTRAEQEYKQVTGQ